MGSLDRSYDGTNIRAKQQSQSSEQHENRINQMKYNRIAVWITNWLYHSPIRASAFEVLLAQ